ncbi:MAG: short-chain dehydrogenase [Actinomycetia bacterium]|nr:short-chain dehydrogenase [Actinomycetes bacterium]
MACTTAGVIAGIDLTGTTAVVTGASAGLGVETVRTLAGAGARVLGTVRDRAKGEAALAGIDGVELVELDLASLASVRAGAEAIRGRVDRIDLLVNNAGVMATPLERTADGFELQLGTNHLGHFLFTTLLLDRVDGRIVNLSSRGHLRSGMRWDDPHFRQEPYDKWLAYGQSKTANILFAVGLAARGNAAFAVHPGRILTELPRHLTEQDFKEMAASGRTAVPIPTKTVEEGAATTIWAATSAELDGRRGLYLEDCHVSTTQTTDPAVPEGHRPDAVDPAEAERLWAWSEEQVAKIA